MIARLRAQEFCLRWYRLTVAYLELTVRELSYTLADQAALQLNFDDHHYLDEGDEYWSD
jgi:hypothetical protein